VAGFALTLQQIEHPAPGQAPRSLRLSGSCGPMEEITWGGTQRHQIEPIPGHPVASVRLDGPEEAEVEIQFVWRSRLFGPADAVLDGFPVANADELVRVADALRRDPALVSLEWRGTTRVGVLTAFEAREGRYSEYECTLTFRPAQPPDYQAVVHAAAPQPRTLLETLERDFEAAVSSAQAAVTFARREVDDVAQRVANVRGALARLRTVVETSALVGVEATRAAGSALQGIVEAASLPVLAPYSAVAQCDDAIGQLRARRYLGQTTSALRAIRARAAVERSRYRPESDILGIHEGVEGETIWSVAWRWYGDASSAAARVISRRNRLTSTSIRPGQRLVIPRRGAGDAA